MSIWLNGHPVDVDDLATLALYNYGSFTSMIVDSGRVRGLDLHLRRLENDSIALTGTSIDRSLVRRLVGAACEGLGRCVVRVTLYPVSFDMGHPGKTLNPDILISVRESPTSAPAPARIQTVSYERFKPDIKHVGLFDALYHRRQAQLAGYDDVLFCAPNGVISEGATWNALFASEDRLVWPDSPVLAGVTMRLLNQRLQREGHEVTFKQLTLSDLSSFRAAFLTNAAVGVRAVSLINETKFTLDQNLLADLTTLYEGIEEDIL